MIGRDKSSNLRVSGPLQAKSVQSPMIKADATASPGLMELAQALNQPSTRYTAGEGPQITAFVQLPIEAASYFAERSTSTLTDAAFDSAFAKDLQEKFQDLLLDDKHKYTDVRVFTARASHIDQEVTVTVLLQWDDPEGAVRIAAQDPKRQDKPVEVGRGPQRPPIGR